ncbi:MAG: methyltransferase [Thermoplasmatales archaeon]|nr:MAG: methyltransferase [Thermoplasmatales archaeon]
MLDTIPNKTFHLNGLVIDLHPEVYDPAEDSFLMIEALKINYGDKILEIGTGCGLIALECARCGAQVICTDVNPFAVQLANHNSKRNRQMLKGTLEVRGGDLFSSIKERELFDIVIFNLPYLPASNEKKVCGWLDVATVGGKDGLQVTKRFIEGIKNISF